MKKIGFIVGIIVGIFFTCAVGLTIYIVMRFNEINNISILIATAVCFYLTAAVYTFVWFKISKHQKYTVWILETNYRKLLDMYEEITDEDTADTLTITAFCSGVREFEILTSSIEAGDYPQKTKDNADSMLDDLMNLMVKITV